jgi:hypothetical protein
MILLAALLVITLAALATSGSAWTTEDIEPGEGDYLSAYIYVVGTDHRRAESVSASLTAMQITSTTRAYMSYPRSHLSERTAIESASITFIARSPVGGTVDVKVMKGEIHEIVPGLAYQRILNAPSAGTVNVPDGGPLRTYTVSITGDALDVLRAAIAGDNDYLVIGFHLTGSGGVDIYARYVDSSGTHYSTLTLEYDDEAPDVPTPDPLDPYVADDHLPITWSPASDNPSGGNTGQVTYQVGMYLPGAPADNPYHTSPWVDGTSWNLTGVVDGSTYTLRIRARDGSGFASNWSGPVNTTVDNSPPSIPVPLDFYEYSIGSLIDLQWYPSQDDGIGQVSYQYQYYHINHAWTLTDVINTTADIVRITGLEESSYFFRVRAIDGLGQASDWSDIVSTTMDSSPPSVPSLIDEPEYTAGNVNVFHWHASIDKGIGYVTYKYQVATSVDFAYDHIHSETYTNETQAIVSDLADGTTYYFRVRSYDAFGFESDWSEPVHSTQDASPPMSPVIHPLPDFIAPGPLTISWDPAIDHGVGVSHYEMWYHIRGPPGSSPMIISIEVIGQSVTIQGFEGGTWDFGLSAVDRFDNMGPWTGFNVTVDGTPPTAPSFEDVQEFSNGTSISLTWVPSTDDGSGLSYYTLTYYREGFRESARYINTELTTVTIFGLEDYTTYWYGIQAYDNVGNIVDGQWIAVTVDNSPPYPVQLKSYPPIFTRETSHEITWFEAYDAGVGGVEYQVAWTPQIYSGPTRPDAYLTEKSEWMTGTSYNLTDLGEYPYTLHVFARDAYGRESNSMVVSFIVDHTEPVVEIVSPSKDEFLSGTIQIVGTIEEKNPVTFSVQYYVMSVGLFDIYETTPIPVDGTFNISWDTTRVPDFVDSIHVTVTDGAGFEADDAVDITVLNAQLALHRADIRFSDPSPSVGEDIVIMIKLRNDGDHAVDYVTLNVFDNGEVLPFGIESGIRVEAHDEYVYIFYFRVTGEHEISARATSDYFDTGEMPVGVKITGVAEESEPSTISDSTAWIGMLAIALSVIAIALNLVGRRATEAPLTDGEDHWVESKDE